MKTSLLLLAFITSQAVLAGSPPPPMTPADAFNQGMTDGATGAAAVSGVINSTSASTNVDAYSTTNANSSYFSNGNGDPRTPGAAQVSTCATTTFANPKVQAECTAINQIAGDRSVRPITPLTPADPMLVLGRATATDPVSVAGAFAAGYTGCTTQTVTTPPIYETDLCTEAKSLQPQTCAKTLSVTVNVQNCNPGDVLYSYSTYKADTIKLICDPDPSKIRVTGNFTGWCYSEYVQFQHVAFVSVDSTPTVVQQGMVAYYQDRTTCTKWIADFCIAWKYKPHGPIATMLPDQTPNNVLFGSYYRRGCMLELKPSTCDLANETCTFNLEFINQYNWDDSYYPDIIVDLTTPPIQTPQHHDVTDSWDTAACSILDARTLP
jgi:hypothetical protein